MQQRYPLLRILADGQFHSGVALGAALGMGRSAVWKHLQALAEWDIDLHAVPGKGYRLARPVDLLDHDLICNALPPTAASALSGLEIHQDIDSTNRHLMNKARLGAPSGQVCLAERQQAGRGRRGRAWVSPFGANIYLSLLWRFTLTAESLTGLGLAIGVAVNRALHETGLTDAGLKWPNDILWQNRKLAGILLEMSGEMSGPCAVVIGVGLNVRMPASVAQARTPLIDQPWVDLETALGRPISRNQLATKLIQHIIYVIQDFELHGFNFLHKEWAQHDLAQGQPVTLHLPHHTGNRTVNGIGRGVDASGALLLEDHTGVRHYPSGEVSLRLVP